MPCRNALVSRVTDASAHEDLTPTKPIRGKCADGCAAAKLEPRSAQQMQRCQSLVSGERRDLPLSDIGGSLATRLRVGSRAWSLGLILEHPNVNGASCHWRWRFLRRR